MKPFKFVFYLVVFMLVVLGGISFYDNFLNPQYKKLQRRKFD